MLYLHLQNHNHMQICRQTAITSNAHRVSVGVTIDHDFFLENGSLDI
jgi:hypothetical protein